MTEDGRPFPLSLDGRGKGEGDKAVTVGWVQRSGTHHRIHAMALRVGFLPFALSLSKGLS